MNNEKLREVIEYLFNRRWDEEQIEDEDNLQEMYDNAIEKYGWVQTFDVIDQYMRTSCLTSESTINFANLFWCYNCTKHLKIPEPYRFLGYLYYRVDCKPWNYDCADLYEGLVYHLLSGEDDYSHNPFTNCDYFPEKDPDIMEEVEKLRKAENVNQ